MIFTELSFWSQSLIGVLYAFVVARWVPHFAFSLLFLILSTVGFVIFPILSNIGESSQVIQAAVESGAIAQRARLLPVIVVSYAVFLLVKYGTLPSIPQILVQKFGEEVNGVIVAVHDTGVQVGVGAANTSFGAKLGAHLNKQASLVLDVEYKNSASKDPCVVRVTGVLGSKKEFEELKNCRIKVSKLFPGMGVWIGV